MLSAAQGATLDVTMEAALWVGVVHIHPMGLVSWALAGSLHFPARLGPGFVPVGEARRARACGPPRLVWPQILQSW